MKKLVIKWIIFSLVIMATCYLPGVKVENFAFAMLIAAILTIVNIFVKPIVKLIALPINLLTFGIFNFVINLGILYAISFFIPQYALTNVLSAFEASLIIAVSYTILKKV